MQLSPSIQKAVAQKASAQFSTQNDWRFTPVGGGSINDCYRIESGEESLFCKVNDAAAFPQLFQKEAAGLILLTSNGRVKTPAVINCFEQDKKQILLLEWIEPGERTEVFWKNFGEALAALHQSTATTFGLGSNNYMGSVPQSNQPQKTWAAFFASERIIPMMQRCYEKKLLSKSHCLQFEKLSAELGSIFNEEQPSLLHGDLWSGNFLCDQNSQPVLIDPAVYYGHRSVDLALTTLFGGFREPFYEAYNHHFPLPPNYREQWAVCNLYPLLIHLYLFGASYLPQIENTLKRFA